MLAFLFIFLLSPSQPAYRLSEPTQHKNLSVYLIFGEETRAVDEKTLSLEEAMDKGDLTVFETGEVNKLAVENKSDRPIFIQAGDIVKGGKQDRVLAKDLLVPPHSGQVSIESFCVESSRWSKRGDEETAAFSSSKNRVAGKEMRKAIRSKGKSQQRVWSNVAEEQSKLSAKSFVDVRSSKSTSSYQLSLENKTLKRLAAVYGKSFGGLIEAHPKAIGFAFCVNGSFSGAEVYASRSLFAKLWPRLIAAAITEAIADYDSKADPQIDDLAWQKDLLSQKAKLPAAPGSSEEKTYRVGEVGELVHYETLKKNGVMVHKSWETKDTQAHEQNVDPEQNQRLQNRQRPMPLRNHPNQQQRRN